jgi:hypothetical protein
MGIFVILIPLFVYIGLVVVSAIMDKLKLHTRHEDSEFAYLNQDDL